MENIKHFPCLGHLILTKSTTMLEGMVELEKQGFGQQELVKCPWCDDVVEVWGVDAVCKEMKMDCVSCMFKMECTQFVYNADKKNVN